MHITFIKDWRTWLAGNTYETTDGAGELLIQMGKAVKAAPENKAIAVAPENKAIKVAPRNKVMTTNKGKVK